MKTTLFPLMSLVCFGALYCTILAAEAQLNIFRVWPKAFGKDENEVSRLGEYVQIAASSIGPSVGSSDPLRISMRHVFQ